MDRQTRAKRIADLHVFYGQNEVVEELIRAGKIDEEYMYRLTWHKNSNSRVKS